MKLNSFSSIPEDDEELHLPELVYYSSLGEFEQVKALLEEGLTLIKQMMRRAIVHCKLWQKMAIWTLFNCSFNTVQMYIIKVNILRYSLLKWQISMRLLSI